MWETTCERVLRRHTTRPPKKLLVIRGGPVEPKLTLGNQIECIAKTRVRGN